MDLVGQAMRTAQTGPAEFWQVVADNIPQLAWVADASGWIFWYNRRWFEFTGTTLADMEGWGWKAVHHPDEVERVVEKFSAAVAKGEPWEDIFPLRSASGEYRQFLSRANPIRDEQGRVTHWFGTNTDVTEQRRDRERDQFLLRLDDALRTRRPQEAIRQAATLLGEELQADRVTYAEVDDGRGEVRIDSEYLSPGMPSAVGCYVFGADDPVLRAYRSGEPLVVEDNRYDERTAHLTRRDDIKRVGARGVLDIPLLRDGRLVGVLAISSKEPRCWTMEEVSLARAAAERTYETVELVRAEAALRESEARARLAVGELEAVYGAAPIGLAVFDRDLRYVRINERLAEINGLPAADHIGRTVGEVVPEIAEQAEAALQRVLEGEEIWGLEISGETPAQPGVVRTWRENWLPMRDAAGEIVGIAVSAEEITESKQAEVALRRSEERYRALFESMEQGFCTIQVTFDGDQPVDYRFTELNPAFTAQSGLGADVLHRSVSEAVPGLEETWFERYGEIARTGISQRFIERAEPLDRWFEVYAFRIGDPAGHNAAILFTDVTERLRQQQALEDSEARLRAVIEAAPVGLIFADADGRITGGNRRVEEIVGHPILPSDSVEEYTEWVAFHSDGRQVQGHEYPLGQVLGEGRDRAELEVRYRRGDGRLSWTRFSAASIRDDRGRLIGGVVASVDIDRERRLTESLEREVERVVAEREVAQEALRQSQKLEAMGQLTGGVAHDFNNLLTPIIGSLDLLHKKQVLDARTQRLVDGALQSAERAKVLVQRLLAFARRQPLQPRAVDVARIVEGMSDLVASTSGPRVRVEVAVAPDMPPALADGNQLEMALLNLSVNARDAMPDGGTLSIGARVEAVGDGAALGLKPGQHIVLSVADTGEGMDEETQRRAVEPFFSTKGLGKGTGLGLSMVHGLAAQLGGALKIRSARGVGTAIELWLPVADEASVRAPAPSEAVKSRGSGIALLVDDEELVRSSSAAMLAELGYDVAEAEDAEAALRLVEGGLHPQVLVTDQLMPGLSGTELAVQLLQRLPKLPVLIVSGYADLDSLAPAFPHLSKPFRQAELAEALRKLKEQAPA